MSFGVVVDRSAAEHREHRRMGTAMDVPLIPLNAHRVRFVLEVVACLMHASKA